MTSVGNIVVEQVDFEAVDPGGRNWVASVNDLVVIRKFLEDNGVLSANDAFISVAYMRSYNSGRVTRWFRMRQMTLPVPSIGPPRNPCALPEGDYYVCLVFRYLFILISIKRKTSSLLSKVLLIQVSRLQLLLHARLDVTTRCDIHTCVCRMVTRARSSLCGWDDWLRRWWLIIIVSCIVMISTGPYIVSLLLTMNTHTCLVISILDVSV